MDLDENMDQDAQAEVSRIKREFFNAERVYSSEKECLLRVINTLSSVMADPTELADEVRNIKQMANSPEGLPVDSIEREIDNLKSKVFSEAASELPEEAPGDRKSGEKGQLLAAYTLVRKILILLTDDFYPISNKLKGDMEALRSCCPEDREEIELQRASPLFVAYINGLKRRIGEDFAYVNTTLLTLLEHVKELENTFMREFAGKARQKEIDRFEAKINDEVGSIVGSFSLHATIEEIKAAVIGKIKKIKSIVSQRKKEELRRSRKAQEHIQKLKTRIAAAEKGARDMSKKAKQFQVAATKDRLTNVYNRSAFDQRLKALVGTYKEGDELFSLGLIDIDNFKWINDTYGHVSGDKVLIRVAQCLRESFRRNDFVARYGGDEFAVIIEGLDAEHANERIGIFNSNFRKKRFRSPDTGNVDVTVSIGIARYKHGESVTGLIARADKEMYAAKKKKKA